MTERILDTSRYKDLPDSIRTPVIHEDLAGLAIEASKLPLEERINPRELEIRGNDVIDPIGQRSVFESFSDSTPFNRRESMAGRLFYGYLLTGGVGTLSISISPPGGDPGYLEGRVNVGLRATEEEIEFYGIPTRLSAESLYFKALLLNEHSRAPILFSDPEELREVSIPVIVPSGENPWDFLDKTIKLDSNAWQVIKQRKPWEEKQRASRDTENIAEVTAEMVVGAKSDFDYLQAGATAERQMMAAGWVLDSDGCPGLFNFQILQAMRGTSMFFVTDAFGGIRLAGRKYVERCGNPNCKKEIKDYITSGYQCPHCKGIYKGC